MPALDMYLDPEEVSGGYQVLGKNFHAVAFQGLLLRIDKIR